MAGPDGHESMRQQAYHTGLSVPSTDMSAVAEDKFKNSVDGVAAVEVECDFVEDLCTGTNRHEMQTKAQRHPVLR